MAEDLAATGTCGEVFATSLTMIGTFFSDGLFPVRCQKQRGLVMLAAYQLREVATGEV